SDASGTLFNPGITTVTYTATDGSGNTGICSFEVNIDNSNAGGMLEFIPEVDFDCDNNTVSIDIVVNNFDSIVGMQFGIRWDLGVLDFVSETNNLPEVSNYNSALEPGALLFTWAHFSSSPSSTSLPAGTVIFTLDFNLVGALTTPLLSFEDFNAGIPILIGNEDGNLTQGTDFDFLPEVLTIIDNTDPTFPSGCPANITATTDAGVCAAVVSLPAATATDDCTAIDSITYTINGNTQLFPNGAPTVDATFAVGTTLVTYTAYDGSGNTATCTFEVSVSDNEDPNMTCPADQMLDTDTDACSATVSLPFPNATDNCAIDSANYTINGITTAFVGTSAATVTLPLGATTIDYAVFDPTGNTDTCSFTVTVSDNQDPNLTCPADINVGTDPGVCTARIALPFPNSSDNCAIDSAHYTTNGVTVGFSVVGMGSVTENFQLGTTSVEYTVFDPTGNSTSCSFNVVVVDNQDPVITCPATINANTDLDACSAMVELVYPTATDNCMIDSATYSIGGLVTPFVGTASATIAFNPGTTTVTYTVFDPSGNSVDCMFEVIVTDAQSPNITCPFDFNVNTDFGTCGTTINLPFPSATDNCGIDSITYTINGTSTTFVGTSGAPTTFPLGTTNVIYTAFSGSETAQCNFNVNVNDNQLPTIVCPADTSVSITGGMSSIVVNNISPTVNDNCSTSPSLSYAFRDATALTGNGDASGQSFNQGTTMVTYYVVDDNGNLDSCSFSVTVNVGLDIACIGDFSNTADPDACSAALSFDGIDILSNPANVTAINYTLSAPSTATGMGEIITETFNVGVTTVEYSVMDNMGQTATCSFDVTVTDDQAPSITCPSIDVTPNAPNSCDAFISIDLSPTLMDNCGIDSFTYVLSNALSGSGTGAVPNMTYPVGTTTVTYTAVDLSGLTATCSFDVVVGDTEAPSITCPADITMTVPAGTMTTTVTVDAPVVGDNCGIQSITYSYSSNSFTLPNGASTIDLDFPVGMTTVTGTVLDDSNNPMTCTFVVTINEDSMSDIIDCPADRFSCDNIVFGISPTFLVNPAGVDLTYSILNVPNNTTKVGLGDASGETFEPGENIVTYTTTTPGSDVCTFTVMVDDTPPTFDQCPGPITAYVGAGNCEATVNWTVPVPMDSCGIELTIPSNSPPATFSVGGPFTVSYVTIDSAGNQGVCAFQVTVLDTIAPVISDCPPTDVVISELSGTCGGTATWTVPSAADNCTPVMISSTHNPGDTFLVSTTVVYTFTDDFGNSADCSFEIVIDNVDNDPPVISGCPNDTIIFTDPGTCTAVYNWVEPTVTDDCSDAFISGSVNPGTAFPRGETTVTYIAFDQAGNE
ncbi:MAG: HYR domain-containing protein, partial [Bacteroidota bacterium]